MSAFNLETETRRVRECAGRRDERSIRIVDAALASKWEGLQSVALQVLGEWGDDESRARIRGYIEQVQDRRYGWAVRGVAVRALAGCVKDDDATWVLDRYFRISGVLAKHELLPLVIALPEGTARERLIVERSATDRDNRQAAMKAIGNAGFRDAADLVRRFLEDEDAEIRRGASILLDRLPGS